MNIIRTWYNNLHSILLDVEDKNNKKQKQKKITKIKEKEKYYKIGKSKRYTIKQ